MIAENPYYYGNAENKLNSKGQVAIPARFRSVVPEEDREKSYIIVRGEGDCLYMYTHRQFSKIKDNARQVAEENGNSDFYRTFMAEACPVDIDGQGRFVLPQVLMREVGITGPNVLFIGIDDRIEIWEPGKYLGQIGMRDKYEEIRRNSAKRIFGI